MKLAPAFLKEKMARGHVEVILSLDRAGANGILSIANFIAGYVQAFEPQPQNSACDGEPDLNVVLRMPGAMDSGAEKSADEAEAAVITRVEDALAKLNEMREQEGRSINAELRARMEKSRSRGRSRSPSKQPSSAAIPIACNPACRSWLGAQIEKAIQ